MLPLSAKGPKPQTRDSYPAFTLKWSRHPAKLVRKEGYHADSAHNIIGQPSLQERMDI
jgi:hypothetical protein